MRVCPRCGYYNSSVATRCERCNARLSEEDAERPRPPSANEHESMHVPTEAPAATAPAQEAATVEYGGFWPRFAATMIDGVIIFVGVILVSTFLPGVLAPSPVLLGPVIYEVGFESKEGSTPGKQPFSLRVVTTDMRHVSVQRSLVRYFAHFLSAFLLIGFIMAAFTPQKRALHDYIAGTVVIKSRYGAGLG